MSNRNKSVRSLYIFIVWCWSC